MDRLPRWADLALVPFVSLALAAILSTPRLRMAAFYRTAIFIPTILSFVIVGFVWKLILSPIWGIAPGMLDMVGLKALFAPWLGKEEYALTTLALISVWQFVGIPMMLIYAALLSIPDEVIEDAVKANLSDELVAMRCGFRNGVLTLGRIAKAHGTTWQDLVKLNGLADPNMIAVGQRLRVPATYIVAKGEGLWTIAQRHGLTVDRLAALNGLTRTSTIHPGQTLRLA